MMRSTKVLGSPGTGLICVCWWLVAQLLQEERVAGSLLALAWAAGARPGVRGNSACISARAREPRRSCTWRWLVEDESSAE